MNYIHSTDINLLSSSTSWNMLNKEDNVERIQCSSPNNTSTTTNIGGIEGMTPLPFSYSPGPFDVICARGKEAKNHPGNKYFRALVKKAVEKYSQATTRTKKTIIVSHIIDTVRHKSPNGGFIKDLKGHWYEVGDHVAREKVGQNIRDLLHGQYKSSTKAKRQRRQEVDFKMYEDFDAVIQGNEYVSKRMEQLAHTIQMQGPFVTDEYLTLLMTQANCKMLDSFKKDESLKKFAIDTCCSSPSPSSNI